MYHVLRVDTVGLDLGDTVPSVDRLEDIVSERMIAASGELICEELYGSEWLWYMFCCRMSLLIG